MLGLAVDLSASIHRIGEHVVDCIRGSDPTDLPVHTLPQRKCQAFAAEPQPHLSRGSQFGQTIEDRTNGTGHSLIRMEKDFTIVLPK
jgi:hypothetical protein